MVGGLDPVARTTALHGPHLDLWGLSRIAVLVETLEMPLPDAAQHRDRGQSGGRGSCVRGGECIQKPEAIRPDLRHISVALGPAPRQARSSTRWS